MNTEQTQNVIELLNLKMYFPITRGLLRRRIGEIKAVDDISFAIRKNETLGLVGESGCGKTTTGRCILRLYKPTAGKILFNGTDISTMKPRYGHSVPTWEPFSRTPTAHSTPDKQPAESSECH